MATKRQTRLQSRGQAEENAAPPPITILLSQYELLTSLCQHLSSADIIHLGATSKEHWQYVTASAKLLQDLIGKSSCDGTGIIAQARVFGYWGANPENATRKCRGKDAQPCRDCGAMICNTCRFHIMYDEEKELCDPHWELDEQNLSEAVDNGDIEEHDFRCQIELKKAYEMDNSTRCIVHCVDCQPLVLKKDMDGPHWCECDGLFGHFCQEWRCIPCVLVEETKLITQGQHREPYVCPCGKMAFVGGMETCGLCGKIQCWAPDQEKLNVERMRLQLGTMTGDRADDPILSQLG